jgi:hypothetical protein
MENSKWRPNSRWTSELLSTNRFKSCHQLLDNKAQEKLREKNLCRMRY